MGGIKNKLNNKLSNKTLFKVPLWLKGDVRRKSDRGIVSDTNPLGSQLPSFSQPSEMLTRNISNTRTSNWWSLYASKTIGSLRLVALTKYLSIACLSLAILSTLVLNIISSYSSSNIESNAIDDNSNEVSTLANDSSSISLSFSNATGICSDTSNPANVCMSIPDGGGIATGGHTVTVNAGNDIASYELKLSSKTEETALVNEDKGSNATAIEPITKTYTSVHDLDGFKNVLLNYGLDNNWAYFVIGGGSGLGYVAPMTSASEPKTIIDSSTGSTNNRDIYYGARVDNPATMLAGNYTTQVVYTVTATLHEPTIASISPTTYELGSNEGLDSTNRLPVTITGNYLSSTSRVYLTNSNTTASNAGTEYDCTNIHVASNGNSLTCTLPTDKTNSDLEAGDYNLTVLADNGTAVLDNAFTYTKPSICRNADPDSDCQVDIDDNMIPVTYVGYDGNGGGYWRIVTKEEIENNKGSWYDYGNKQWANAITLRGDFEAGCFSVGLDSDADAGVVHYFSSSRQCEISARGQSADARAPEIISGTIYTPLGLAKAWSNGELPDGVDASQLNEILFSSDVSDGTSATEVILGYWVYIPRYAYEVQRRDAIDRVVDPQNFDIVFQTADEKNIPAPSCNSANSVWVDGTPVTDAGSSNSNILSKDYRTGCWPNNRTYVANSSNTTWATHPAFTWGDTELNGIWVGKFETTGKITAPTVKPNQHANISEYIGEFYTMSKSIGKEDKCNVGGNTISGMTQNSHNLQTTKSHMLKNSEWGAITYLAHSKYGAGINTSYTRDTNVNKNGAYPSSSADADGTSSRYGITGCGPVSAGSTSNYTDGTPLSADVIESPTACSQDITRAYNGSLGVLSSTTNTIYGVYDLSGGASEYVMGNRTTSATETSTAPSWPEVFTTPAKEPYVDLYVATLNGPFGTKPSWSSGSSEYLYNYDVCTFGTCGGTATYETTTVQSVSSGYQSWGGAGSYFVDSSDPWFYRGGHSNNGSASPFYTGYTYGSSYTYYGSRAALLALPAQNSQ